MGKPLLLILLIPCISCTNTEHEASDASYQYEIAIEYLVRDSIMIDCFANTNTSNIAFHIEDKEIHPGIRRWKYIDVNRIKPLNTKNASYLKNRFTSQIENIADFLPDPEVWEPKKISYPIDLHDSNSPMKISFTHLSQDNILYAKISFEHLSQFKRWLYNVKYYQRAYVEYYFFFDNEKKELIGVYF